MHGRCWRSEVTLIALQLEAYDAREACVRSPRASFSDVSSGVHLIRNQCVPTVTSAAENALLDDVMSMWRDAS